MNAESARTFLLIGLTFAPATALARHPHRAPTYGYGTVSVHNDTPATITIDLGGQVRTLPPQMSAALTVPAGSARLSASYVLYGQVRSLSRQEVYVEPGRFRWVDVDTPSLALVQVRNELPQTSAIFSDGAYVGSVAPFGTQLVSMRPGTHDVSLVVDGRVVERERVHSMPMRESRVVAEAPRFADVHIQNPLPIPIVLGTERGLTRTIAAYSSACLDDLVVGSVRLIARRTTGELIDDTTLSVTAFGDNRWVVDAPRTGFVSLDNDSSIAVNVYEGSRLLTSLTPGQESRLVLGIGSHELTVRDCHGREIEERWVEVRPYDVARLEVDERRHERAYSHRDDDADSDSDDRRADRDGRRRKDCEDGRC